jgi:hypothetical protein
MNDNEAVDKLIEETEIDPDALLVQQYTGALHEICGRRGWPGGAIFIVRRSANMVSVFGTSNFKNCEESYALLERGGKKGAATAVVIQILSEL